MKKYIVVYCSKTGFAKKYAQWIAKQLAAECVELASFDTSQAAQHERILYGAGVYAGKIAGLKQMQRMLAGTKTEFYCYAVGMSDLQDKQRWADMWVANGMHDTSHCFALRGGYNAKGLNFFENTVIRIILKSMAKKEHIPFTRDTKYIDFSGETQITALIEAMTR